MTTTLDLPVHPDTGLTAIGLIAGLPVWPVRGAASDDEDDGDTGMDLEGGGKKTKAADQDDDTEKDEDDDTEKGDDGEEDEWQPPTKEEWEKVQASLARANEEAKKHRVTARELRTKQRAAAKTAEKTGDEDDQAAADRAKNAEETAMRKLKPVAVRSAAVAALLKADLQNPTDARLNRLVGRLDMDELDVDLDNGEVEGLDEQITDLVDEFPELFTKPTVDDDQDRDRDRGRRRTARISGAGRQNKAPEPKTTGEKHAARLQGRA